MENMVCFVEYVGQEDVPSGWEREDRCRDEVKNQCVFIRERTFVSLVVKSKSLVFREGNEAVELAKTRTCPFCHRYEVGFARRMGTTTMHAGKPSEKRYLC
jgi:hypothetical protein